MNKFSTSNALKVRRVNVFKTDGLDDEKYFTYVPRDKESEHILRYIYRTEDHQKKLKSHLYLHKIQIADIHEKSIILELREGCNANADECIKKFFTRYMTWNEKFESDEYGPLIERTIKDNKGKCFCKWWQDTKTILMIGPKDIVQGIKGTITSDIEEITENASTAYASSFTFSQVQPSVLRFVLKNSEEDLQSELKSLALVKITSTNDILSVHVSPIRATRFDKQIEFKRKCSAALQQYFSKYDVWKKKFDVVLEEAFRAKLPQSFFKESASPDVHTKWHLNTGTVVVCGVKSKVEERKQLIEQKFGVASQKKQPQPRPYHTSSISTLLRPSPALSIPYDLEDGKIERAVLLFVQKNPSTKMSFEKCCFPYGKAVMRSEKSGEKGNISISINFSSQKHSEKTRTIAFKMIEKFFTQFSSQTQQYNRKDLEELLESSPELLYNIPDELHILKFDDSGTVKITGLAQKVTQRHEEIQKLLKVNAKKDIEIFMEMSKRKANHIKQKCKIYKAKNIEIRKTNGKSSIVVTCEKRDQHQVEAELEELKKEIVSEKIHIEGYGLYESLKSTEDYLKIELHTGCSIFLDNCEKDTQQGIFSVVYGDILNEQCEAIINSTDKDLSFSNSGQVDRAICKQASRDVLMKISEKKVPIPPLSGQEALLYEAHDFCGWQYIINVHTPTQATELKKFLVNLLHAANKFGIKSLAMPTIGTGNLGLNSATVADCMKEAFEAYQSDQTFKILADVRVVVFDFSLLPVFKVAVPLTSANDLVSKGIRVTIYSNNQSNLNQASKKMKDICKSSITEEILENLVSAEFSEFVKESAAKISQQHRTHLQFEKYGSNERCILQGSIDAVRAAKEEIQKLLVTGPYWSPMSGTSSYEKFVVRKDSLECKKVESKFKKSSPSFTTIVKIERIQNSIRYRQFIASMAATRNDLKDDPTKSVTKELFHGTAYANCDPICRDGFNRSFAGDNVGAIYGKGVYFHVNSSYSVQYSGGSIIRCMFLAEVVTGNYTKGSRDLKCAPINEKTGKRFDSVVDDIKDPAIYVVFPDASCYPLYLITFL